MESDAGGVWSATRAAKTLHGDTAKHPRPPFGGVGGVLGDKGVFPGSTQDMCMDITNKRM